MSAPGKDLVFALLMQDLKCWGVRIVYLVVNLKCWGVRIVYLVVNLKCWGVKIVYLVVNLKCWGVRIVYLVVNLPIRGIPGCCPRQLVGVRVLARVGLWFFANSRSLHPLSFVSPMPNLPSVPA